MNNLTGRQSAAYWNNIHHQTEDDLAAVCYPDRSRRFNRFFDRIQRFEIRRGLKRLEMDPSGKNILDLGCGRGRWLAHYRSLRATVTGLDLSHRAVQTCRRRGFDVVRGTMGRLPFDEETMDIVHSVTALQHLPWEEQEEAAKEIHRVARHGGYALLLESTWEDPSPHVWGRSVQGWVSLFPAWEMVLSTSHCRILALRALWKIAVLIRVTLIRRILEEMLIPVSYMMECWSMLGGPEKRDGSALQHLMIFRKK